MIVLTLDSEPIHPSKEFGDEDQEWISRASIRKKGENYDKYYYPGRIMFIRQPSQVPNINNKEFDKKEWILRFNKRGQNYEKFYYPGRIMFILQPRQNQNSIKDGKSLKKWHDKNAFRFNN